MFRVDLQHGLLLETLTLSAQRLIGYDLKSFSRDFEVQTLQCIAVIQAHPLNPKP